MGNLKGTLGSAKINVVENVIPDWNQNDPNAKDYVKNRPGGYDIPPTVDISWDGDVTGKEIVKHPKAKGTYFVKIIDEAPPAEQFLAAGDVRDLAATALVVNNRYSAETAVKLSGSQNDDTNTYVLGCDEYGLMVIGVLEDDDNNVYGMTLSRGLWVLAMEERESEC